MKRPTYLKGLKIVAAILTTHSRTPIFMLLQLLLTTVSVLSNFRINFETMTPSITSGGLFGRGMGPLQCMYLHRPTHMLLDIVHAPSRIRAHDPSDQAVEDSIPLLKLWLTTGILKGKLLLLFLAYFPYFEKIKRGLSHRPVCGSVPPLLIFFIFCAVRVVSGRLMRSPCFLFVCMCAPNFSFCMRSVSYQRNVAINSYQNLLLLLLSRVLVTIDVVWIENRYIDH
jgi:hypothetical protein